MAARLSEVRGSGTTVGVRVIHHGAGPSGARASHCDRMDVTVGTSDRWGRGESPPLHLIVEVANRQVLACTGGAGGRLRPVPFDAVNEELGCGPCRQFWRRVFKTPNA
jgi:hypothetical protein